MLQKLRHKVLLMHLVLAPEPPANIFHHLALSTSRVMNLNILMGDVFFRSGVRAFFHVIPRWIEAGMTGWPQEVSEFHKM